MNSSFLAKYLDVRFTGELSGPPPEHKGMVITVSRDTGCDGIPIVKEVIKQLNANLKGVSKKHPWRFVSKEIFEKSAKKLNVKLDIFDNLEDAKDKNFIEDIISAFSTEQYPSDFKIKRTYREVIESVATAGGVVVLGRAGVAIVGHNRRTLHIKLTAPLEWRVNKMAKEYGFRKPKTLKHINESDKNRADLKKYYMGRKIQYTDYDLVLNVSTLTKKEISSAVVSMIEEKGKK
jgi:cytidylate kinase